MHCQQMRACPSVRPAGIAETNGRGRAPTVVEVAGGSPSAPPRRGGRSARNDQQQQQQRGRDSRIGGLPLWPLSETSCQSAASSPLRISRIPAALLLPVLHAAWPAAFRRNLFAGQSPPLHDPLPSPRFLEKERPPACIEKPARKTARCVVVARSVGQGSPPITPGSGRRGSPTGKSLGAAGASSQAERMPPGRVCSACARAARLRGSANRA